MREAVADLRDRLAMARTSLDSKLNFLDPDPYPFLHTDPDRIQSRSIGDASSLLW